MLIAYRELTYAPRGLPRVKVPIRMFAPEGVSGDYKCRFEIEWPDQPRRSQGSGIDEFQALDMAQKMIAIEIYHSKSRERPPVAQLARSRLWLSDPPFRIRASRRR